jgi:creatinine amidohydrolase
MRKDKGKELRVRYMLPGELREAREKLPLIYLPLAPLEWHGPHLALGTDAVNAEKTALAVAEKTGGVVLPTLHMGTERERSPEMLESLGFEKDEYIVGMDFPEAKGLYNSFYCPEGLFAMVVREHILQCISHGYKYIFIVNGHGATNHQEVLARLCCEFNNTHKELKTGFAIAFPEKAIASGLCSHAGKDETSLLMHFDEKLADINELPPKPEKLKYKYYSAVDAGGFGGNPGEDHAIIPESDPRDACAEFGEELFKASVNDIVKKVKNMIMK